MTIPASYSEVTLADFMISELRSVATALNWTSGSMGEAVNSAILDYGVTDIADCIDIPKIRAIARVEAWKAVMADVSGDYDFRDGNSSYSRSQVHKQAKDNLESALLDAYKYLPDYKLGLVKVKYPQDPYKRDAYESVP